LLLQAQGSVPNKRRYDRQQETKRAAGNGKGREVSQGYVVSNRPIRTTIDIIVF
jgi:hypothetical protein